MFVWSEHIIWSAYIWALFWVDGTQFEILILISHANYNSNCKQNYDRYYIWCIKELSRRKKSVLIICTSLKYNVFFIDGVHTTIPLSILLRSLKSSLLATVLDISTKTSNFFFYILALDLLDTTNEWITEGTCGLLTSTAVASHVVDI